MRFLWLMALLCRTAAWAQPGLWDRFVTEQGPGFTDAHVSEAQNAAIQRLLKARVAADKTGCELQDPDGQWLRVLQYKGLRLGPGQDAVLITSNGDCTHGQVNGAMWLLRFEGSRPVLLASPANGFYGWFYEVVGGTAPYGDLVLGWHINAAETDLSYFQFRGRGLRKDRRGYAHSRHA